MNLSQLKIIHIRHFYTERIRHPACEMSSSGTVDDHKLQFYDIVKKEPAEVINGHPIIEMDPTLKDPFILKSDLSEMYLTSTVKIEEMNLNHLKNETHLDEKASIVQKQGNTLQLQSPASKMPRSKKRNHMDPRKMMKIAKEYVDLHSDVISHPTPYLKVLGFPIIQCPSCMISKNSRGRTAFLDLLLHVTRRHPNNCSFLFSIICERYMSLIGRMKRTVENRSKTRYALRFRITEHRRNVPGD